MITARHDHEAALSGASFFVVDAPDRAASIDDQLDLSIFIGAASLALTPFVHRIKHKLNMEDD